MNPYFERDGVTVYQGDCRLLLAGLSERSVQCCITSPPFYGLRDYKLTPSVWGGDTKHAHEWFGALSERRVCSEVATTPSVSSTVGGTAHHVGASRANASAGSNCACGAWLGCLGLEPTPELYVQHLVEVFRAVWRVLRDDGVLWLNLGDSYAANRSYQVRDNKHVDVGNSSASHVPPGYKQKDLLGIPWMTAFALRTAGWYLRRDIIWSKGNPMPESVQDRCTTSHEYVFMLSKQPDYFYDAEAIREKDVGTDHPRRVLGGQPSLEPSNGVLSPHSGIRTTEGRNGHGRNKRSVWTVNTKPFGGAHFAVFPEELVAPMVLASTSKRGACSECGAPWERVVVRGATPPENPRRHPAKRLKPGQAGNVDAGNMGFRASNLSGQEMARWRLDHPDRTTGWHPTCVHYDNHYRDLPKARSARKRLQRQISGDWWRRVRRRPGDITWPTVPQIVLDPFAGSGTAGVVARQAQRAAILLEANPAYCELIKQRISAPLGRYRVQRVTKQQADLFAQDTEEVVPSVFDQASLL